MPWITRAAPIACLLALAGCAARGPAGLDLDTSITAVSQSSRVRAVVLHYTSTGNENSLKILSERKVSAHYLITDTPRPRVYRLVDETRAAWHASISAWYDQSTMNSTSIGIELVNPGWTNGEGNWTRGGHGDTDSRHWAPYSDAQIETLIVLLRDIVARHGIAPENIVGHSDIAPQRKVDPGPLFPWQRLAQAGLGRWYDEAGAAAHLARLQTEGVPDIAWFQGQLARLGYATPQSGVLDTATRNVLAAFQMHYRPARHDGQPDAETAAIMLALR
ncbi:hydrolase [Bordetella pertussis]|uniref:N-acetylmuramoyl-L-alanine amidase n=6 Tax=Bordetella pertussis TaxID=520 RepID=Q7VW23_BORPE|nr:N-acetylmuramoyl-L-alanine amidase [Bordetella pertussis]ETH37777.1 N-acetylmuramoyl-L-alanine amidase [Bordetella pertussis H918]ETH45040.1 N-acetylmuramoyl-L-alanine amidase [Bordetella pertussis H939]ETH46947.1 N-acetylmuramoyl-L-alanine amidase [Bordetella pertussis H921]ETH72332.1 N-acetylmuramoyl-L-alanine amidase [Bordetella pertussis STO1-CHLA-0011]ETH82766.1 N-acetylmuramoyl-L-alanine amidase [Bordetella pertussis STO1-CHOC-0017]ETH85246.1 N-acetylmuramoyl-L-alanine amidase [Borde